MNSNTLSFFKSQCRIALSIVLLVALSPFCEAQKTNVTYYLGGTVAVAHPDSDESGPEEYKWRIKMLNNSGISYFTSCTGDGDCFNPLDTPHLISTKTYYPYSFENSNSDLSISADIEFWEDDCGDADVYDDAWTCPFDADDTYFSTYFGLGPGIPKEHGHSENFDVLMGEYSFLIFSRNTEYVTYTLGHTLFFSNSLIKGDYVTGGDKPFWTSYGSWGANFPLPSSGRYTSWDYGYTTVSGSINTNETSTFAITEEGADSVSFTYKISDGIARLYVDDEVRFEQTTTNGKILDYFETATVALDFKSSHTLKWEFTNLKTGEDALKSRMVLGEIDLHEHPITSTNPDDFGQNEWFVHAYSGDDLDLTATTYKGMYVDNNVNINTRDFYDKQGAPSEPSNYVGQYVEDDNHTVVHKREGFECGDYTININYHDDGIRIYIDGNQVFENTGWGLSHDNVWTGHLDENSQVEIRTVDNRGNSITNVEFVRSVPFQVPSISYEALDVCDEPILIENQTPDYGYSFQWYKDSRPLPGETGESLSVNEKGDYHLVLSEPSCDLVSESITVTDHRNVLPIKTIFEGDSALIFGEYKKASDKYLKTIPLTNGCDSIITQYLNVLRKPNNHQCGHVLHFDGIDDYVEVNSIADDISQDFTFEMFFRTSAINSNNLLGVNTLTGGNVVLIRIDDGFVRVFDGANGAFELTTEQTYNNNTWHYLVYRKEGNYATLYLDQIEVGRHEANYSFSTSDQWSLGQEFDNSNTSDFFDGYMDQLRVWSTAIDPPIIISTLVNPITGSEPNLMAAYDFEESPSTSILTDVSLFNHQGKLINMNTTMAWQYEDGEIVNLDSGFVNTSLKRGEYLTVGDLQHNSIGESILHINSSRGCDSVVVVNIEYSPLNDQCGTVLDFSEGGLFTVQCDTPNYWAYESATFEFWIKSTATNRVFTIASFDHLSQIRMERGQLRAYREIRHSTEIELGLYGIVTSKTYNDNKWHHIALTVEGWIASFYVDGQYIGRYPIGNIPNPLSCFEFIFMDGQNLDVTVDEFIYWRKALSQKEIIARILDDKHVNEPDVVSYFDFNVQTGTPTLLDLESNFLGKLVDIDMNQSFLRLDGGNLAEPIITEADAVLLQRGDSLIFGNGLYTNTPGLDTIIDGCVNYVTQICYEPLNSIDCDQVLSLDGVDDYVDLQGVAEDLEASSNFSIESWIKTTDTQENSIVSVNTSTGGNIVLLRISDGYAKVYDGTSSSFEITSAAQYNDGKWHHVVYTLSGTTGKLYVDGDLVGIHEAGYTLSSTNQWSIGQEYDNSTPSDFFKGSVDEVVIWNKTLSQTEIIDRVLDTIPVDNASVISHYSFNKDFNGSVIHDDHEDNNGVLFTSDVTQNWSNLSGQYKGDSYIEISANSYDSFTILDSTFYESGIYEVITTNSFGCDSIIDLDLTINDPILSTHDNTSLIAPLSLEQKVSIYPNPNHGEINVELARLKDVTIKVFNSQAQLIYEKANISFSHHHFELNETPGIYLLEIYSKNQKKSYRLILK